MLTYSLLRPTGEQDRRTPKSLYEQLYAHLRKDIETGAIPAGTKLPSKRAFAKHLGVSTITVEGAYRQLASEGYVQPEERRGFFVCKLTGSPSPQTAHPRSRRSNAPSLADTQPKAVSKSKRRCGDADATDETNGKASKTVFPKQPATEKAPQEASRPDASCGSIDEPPACTDAAIELFPYHTWARTIRHALTEETALSVLSEPQPFGAMRLRRAIASYVHGQRGMDVNPENIVIGAGAQVLYNLIVQLLGADTRAAVEDPGYARLGKIYSAAGVSISFVPLDKHGMNPKRLEASRATVAHLMPSHQFPTGLITPVTRRRELLNWANAKSNRYIVEDDFDCEFRLSGRPIPTMASIDDNERVIYVNTFSKSLGAAFRIGYMVLPDHLAKAYREKLDFYSCTVSTIDQLALARFIECGDYERHVNRVRTRCRHVQTSLIDRLKHLDETCELEFFGEGNGMHFVLSAAKHACNEEERIAAAYRAQVHAEQSARLAPAGRPIGPAGRINRTPLPKQTLPVAGGDSEGNEQQPASVPAPMVPLSRFFVKPEPTEREARFVIDCSKVAPDDVDFAARCIVAAIEHPDKPDGRSRQNS